MTINETGEIDFFGSYIAAARVLLYQRINAGHFPIFRDATVNKSSIISKIVDEFLGATEEIGVIFIFTRVAHACS